MKKATKKKSKVVAKKLTRAEKRVAVAKDVLAQLRARKYFAMRGTYCDFEFKPGALDDDKYDLEVGEDIQTALAEKVARCNVCALGSLFCSYARKFDGVKMDAWRIDQDAIHSSPLGKLFTPNMLFKIESDFEELSYETGTEALTKIAKSIIKNDGKYISPWDAKT